MRSMATIAFAAAISVMGAAACGEDVQERTARELAPAPPTADSGPPALSPSTPTASAYGSVPEELEGAARKLLADELGADEGDFSLDSSEGVGWSDASLGCPQEGRAYAQVLTPGYKLVFELAGTSYPVHTNSDGSQMVLCGDEQ